MGTPHWAAGAGKCLNLPAQRFTSPRCHARLKAAPRACDQTSRSDQRGAEMFCQPARLGEVYCIE
ncbi:hypothetical protein HUU40_09145 [candidate division KSB1 bacterium]|nr:hypothetical protein [candidate division KSB1 bacterium]